MKLGASTSLGRRIAFAIALLGASIARADASADGPAVQLETIQRIAPAEPAASRPKLDDIFKSVQSGGVGSPNLKPLPLALLAAGATGAALAIRGWNRKHVRKPRPSKAGSEKGDSAQLAGDHARLIREVARATGLSRRTLRRLEASARAGGLSSPLVAAICPSVMVEQATRARSGIEKTKWAALSRQLAGR